MSLQTLVDYFNDRFEQEHRSHYRRPFILENGLVSGLFGPIRIGPIRISSVFAPLYEIASRAQLIGHVSACSVSAYDDDFQRGEIVDCSNLLTDVIKQPVDFQSIINIDRLCRTVHILNALAIRQAGDVLVLDVDPRHILGIKQDHGAYFEEIVVKCGLETRHIAISMTVNNFYALHHTRLLEGLNNYRQRGYRIALNVGRLYAAHGVTGLVTKLSPDYLRVIAPENNGRGYASAESQRLDALKTLTGGIGGRIIVQQQNPEEQAPIAAMPGFDLVQGGYYGNCPDGAPHRLHVTVQSLA